MSSWEERCEFATSALPPPGWLPTLEAAWTSDPCSEWKEPEWQSRREQRGRGRSDGESVLSELGVCDRVLSPPNALNWKGQLQVRDRPSLTPRRGAVHRLQRRLVRSGVDPALPALSFHPRPVLLKN